MSIPAARAILHVSYSALPRGFYKFPHFERGRTSARTMVGLVA